MTFDPTTLIWSKISNIYSVRNAPSRESWMCMCLCQGWENTMWWHLSSMQLIRHCLPVFLLSEILIFLLKLLQ